MLNELLLRYHHQHFNRDSSEIIENEVTLVIGKSEGVT